MRVTGAWSYEQVVRAYDELRFTYDAKSEAKIREMARSAALATQSGAQMMLGGYTIAGDTIQFPVRGSCERGPGYRTGHRYIEVRLLPGMEYEEAQIIAERQIREQWRCES